MQFNTTGPMLYFTSDKYLFLTFAHFRYSAKVQSVIRASASTNSICSVLFYGWRLSIDGGEMFVIYSCTELLLSYQCLLHVSTVSVYLCVAQS